MENINESWNNWLVLKGVSATTIYHYNKYFKKIDFQKLDYNYISKFLRRFNNGVSRATIRNLFEFIKENPHFSKEHKELALYYNIPKRTGTVKRKIPNVLTRNQVHYLAKSMAKIRDRYMVLVSFYCGLRSQELLNVRIDSFDFDNNSLKVTGKGNKERIIPVPKELIIRLAEYINNSIDKNPKFNYLFPVSSRYWRKITEKTGEKHLGRKVNPHLLRHSSASYLHNSGLDLKQVSEYLGHASILTTQIYTHIDKEKLKKDVSKAFE